MPLVAPRRHFLPGDRQKLPCKLLKNMKNPRLVCSAISFKGQEAAWIVGRRHVGLEIEE
jgi:hypothetical protein